MELLGGKDNIISEAHCATRLRLVMKDESKIDQAQVEEIDGLKGAFSSSGQY
ncbi:PTS transporter subunit EIIB, partial [Bacillus spizizenii]|uniref:PTS transporter subunit EIIB n=1 Tax=Bacillus spizizenii TaxID=96241 RepID=UPI001F61EED8